MGRGIADFGRSGLYKRTKFGPEFCVWGVHRPVRPKSATPHPISIQNMRFER